MFSTCISCAADLGRNRTLASFDVGRMIAYDPEKAALWVVCPECAQWNLAPIEEREDAIREAESCFFSTVARHQSGGIGIARASDGLSLVRIGDASSGELAAWRYGRRLITRRRYALLASRTSRVADGEA
jgi:hypothetical protein